MVELSELLERNNLTWDDVTEVRIHRTGYSDIDREYKTTNIEWVDTSRDYIFVSSAILDAKEYLSAVDAYSLETWDGDEHTMLVKRGQHGRTIANKV